MGEQRLGALAMGLAAEDAAAGRHAHHQWAGELPVRPVTQSRRLRDDLVIGGIHVVSELDLDTGLQPVRRHAHSGTDDAQFTDRRIEAPARPVFRLQALRGAKYATKEAYVLAEYDNIAVALHHHVHGVADCLDHGP